MKVICTANNSILSKAIRWIFKEPASHIAFLFDNDKWLLHSNLLGVNLRLTEAFFKKHPTKIIDWVEYDLPLEQEEEIFQSLLLTVSEADYDFPGFFYLGYRGFMFRIFGWPLPEFNCWGKVDMKMCQEMVENLPRWLTKLDGTEQLGMMTPWKTLRLLKAVYALRCD